MTTTNGSFLITGTYNSYGDKKIGISTRNVTEDDDAGFYNEAMGTIHEVFFLITTFFKENMLPATSEPEQYLSQYSDANKEDFVGLSKEELVNRAIDELQKRGAIIMMPEGGSLEVDHTEGNNALATEDVKTTLDTRTGSIDGKHLQEVGEDNTAKIDPEKTIEEFKNQKIDKEKHPDNAGDNTKKATSKKSKPESNDREFPPDNISDEDIKAATGAVLTEEAIPPEKGPKVKKKSSDSTLVSEKDFAQATGEQVREDAPVDLHEAEFSENGAVHDVDDWNANVTDESELSSMDLEDSVQNQE